MTYAIAGLVSGELLSLGGRPIVHEDRAELEWLLPGARIVAVTLRDLHRQSPLPPLPIREHPDLCGLTWPLTREQFR